MTKCDQGAGGRGGESKEDCSPFFFFLCLTHTLCGERARKSEARRAEDVRDFANGNGRRKEWRGMSS